MGLRDWAFDRGFDAMKLKYMGVAVRLVLTSTGVTLAGKADDSMVNEIAGALLVLFTAAWSMYEKRSTRAELVNVLAVAQISENANKALVADPRIASPSVNTPPDMVPAPVQT